MKWIYSIILFILVGFVEKEKRVKENITIKKGVYIDSVAIYLPSINYQKSLEPIQEELKVYEKKITSQEKNLKLLHNEIVSLKKDTNEINKKKLIVIKNLLK